MAAFTGIVVLYFDDQNVVGGREFEDIDPEVRIEAIPLDNLLWRAKRQWHRWFPE
jgi:hypothetical protein